MALENVITTLVLDVIDHDQTQGVVKAIAFADVIELYHRRFPLT